MCIEGVKISNIDSLDIAKQAATLLEKENQRLHRRVETLLEEVASLKGTVDSKAYKQELLKLQEQASAMKNSLYGASSERRCGKDGKPPEKPKRESKAKQVNLPIVVEEHELADDDKTCSSCNGVLKEWAGQFEEYEEIDIVPREFRVVRHKRKKYRCECGCAPVTAPGPLRLRGSKYSLDFAISVVVNKWGLHLPHTRQSAEMGLDGLGLSDAQLWQVSELLARVLTGTYENLGESVAVSELFHADETRWPMLANGRMKWWMWAFSNYHSVYIVIDKTRGHEVPKKFFETSKGVAVVDGYAAYGKVVKLNPNLMLAWCWSHARRKFIEAEKAYPEATEMIDMMRDLFMIERELPDFRFVEGNERSAALKIISDTRSEMSKPIVEKAEAWMKEQRALPSSTLAIAINYLAQNMQHFRVFLSDPRVPMTNNQAERCLRSPVIGRKNHYGSKSERGTEVAALFYSLIGTCRMQGIDPSKYLRAAAETALKTPGAVLLPHDFLAATNGRAP